MRPVGHLFAFNHRGKFVAAYNAIRRATDSRKNTRLHRLDVTVDGLECAIYVNNSDSVMSPSDGIVVDPETAVIANGPWPMAILRKDGAAILSAPVDILDVANAALGVKKGRKNA